MAEVENTNTTNESESKNKIEIAVSPIDFKAITDTMYLTSREFCEMVTGIFRSVFADFEGSTISGIPNTPFITVNLFFNHKDYTGTEMPIACSKDGNINAKGETLRMIRRYNNQINNGDRYFLVPEAQEALKPFLMDNVAIYDKNHNVNWGKVVSEVADNSSNFFYGVPTRLQYTKVSYIDPGKIAAMIYGTDSSEEGSKWAYGVRVASSTTTFNNMSIGNANGGAWTLGIDRVSAKELEKLASRFGLTNLGNGLGIVR